MPSIIISQNESVNERLLLQLRIVCLSNIYRVLKMGEPYHEIGAEGAHEKAVERREQSMIRLLERAGYSVTKAATA